MHAAAGSVETAAGNGETYGAGNYENDPCLRDRTGSGISPYGESSCYGKRNPWQCVQ